MTTPSADPSVPGSAAPVALVAGGSRGLGLCIARELGARGYRLVVCARDAGRLAEAKADLVGRGYTVDVRVCDVADADAVQAMVDDVEDRTGPIEVLMCVAGVIQVGPLAAMHRSHFVEAVDIMLWGPVNTALSVQGPMVERGHGRIGIVSSIGGLVSVPHLLPYSTAKFGATGFARGLRSELAGTGVTVTTIAPGLTRTGSHLMAKFVGNQAAEYSWFSPGASIPGVSMDAERAARRIVQRTLEGRAMVLTTPLAQIGMRVNGVAPSVTALALDLASRLLPDAPAGDEATPLGTPAEGRTVEGWEAANRLSPAVAAVVKRLTALGTRAAERFNQPHADRG